MPLPGGRGPSVSLGGVPTHCYKCNAPIKSESGVCGRCGWDGVRARRACLKCGSLVTLNVHGLSLGVQGVAVAGVSITVGFFFGFLGFLALALGLSAFTSLVYAQGVGYRCESCGQRLAPRYISDAERTELGDQRSRYRIGAFVLAALCAGAVALWVVALPHKPWGKQAAKPAVAPTSLGTPAKAVPPPAADKTNK